MFTSALPGIVKVRPEGSQIALGHTDTLFIQCQAFCSINSFSSITSKCFKDTNTGDVGGRCCLLSKYRLSVKKHQINFIFLWSWKDSMYASTGVYEQFWVTITKVLLQLGYFILYWSSLVLFVFIFFFYTNSLKQNLNAKFSLKQPISTRHMICNVYVFKFMYRMVCKNQIILNSCSVGFSRKFQCKVIAGNKN